MTYARRLVTRWLAATHVIPRTCPAPPAAPTSIKPLPLPLTLPDSFIVIDPSLSHRLLHSADSAISLPLLSFEELVVNTPAPSPAAAAAAQAGPFVHQRRHEQQQPQQRQQSCGNQDPTMPPSPSPPSTFTAVVIHGMLGSGRNWRTPSKLLGQALLQPHSAQSQVGLRHWEDVQCSSCEVGEDCTAA